MYLDSWSPLPAALLVVGNEIGTNTASQWEAAWKPTGTIQEMSDKMKPEGAAGEPK
jgi:hypothetical protein